MAKAARPIPNGFTTITPQLIVKGAEKAVAFYKKAFGADLLMMQKMEGTDLVIHAQLAIGNAIVMLNDEFPDWGCFGPAAERNSPVTIHIYVEDVDAAFQRAIDAGAEATMPLADMFWGDRYGTLKDPFGHSWSIATRIEDLTEAEVAERGKQAFAG